MITTNKLINGIKYEYHKLIDIDVDLNNGTVVANVGSWSTENTSGKPEATTSLTLKYPKWDIEHYENLEDTINKHPEWADLEAVPAKLEEDYIWHPLTSKWDEPAYPPIDIIKFDKWLEIKINCSTAENKGIIWDNSVFDSSPTTIQRINNFLQLSLLDSTYTVEWTLLNNTNRTLTAEDIKNVFIALNAHINACHQKKQALRNQLNLATTMAEIKKIVW